MADLEINIGDEYKIKIEKTKEEIKKSFFKEVYLDAARNVEAIVFQAKERRESKRDKNSFIKSDEYNNIIAFIGERGTGKSSSMISFACILENRIELNEVFKECPVTIKTSFLVLDMVDPSMFSRKDTLFEIIISTMFSKFEKHLSNNQSNSQNSQQIKMDLVKSFQKVYENLKSLHAKKESFYEKEAIEVLSKLSHSINLKETFHELVNQYLSFFNQNDGFLVLIIDDFDLNVTGASSMLEDLRKFLIQDNVIVLLACKIQQLENSLELETITEYKNLIEKSRNGIDDLADSPKKMASRYLQKLIPIDHRRYTPSIVITSSYLGLKIRNKKAIITENRTIEGGLLHLIFDRIKIFISKSDNDNNLLVPKTIRELSNLIVLLQSSENNIQPFKEYLLQEIENNIPEYYSEFKDLEESSLNAVTYYINNYKENKIVTNELSYYNPLERYEPTFYKDQILDELNSFTYINPLSVFYYFHNIKKTNRTLNKFYTYLSIYYALRLHGNKKNTDSLIQSKKVYFPFLNNIRFQNDDLFEFKINPRINHPEFILIFFKHSNSKESDLTFSIHEMIYTSIELSLTNSNKNYYDEILFALELNTLFNEELKKEDTNCSYGKLIFEIILNKTIKNVLIKLSNNYKYLEIDVNIYEKNILFESWRSQKEKLITFFNEIYYENIQIQQYRQLPNISSESSIITKDKVLADIKLVIDRIQNIDKMVNIELNKIFLKEQYYLYKFINGNIYDPMKQLSQLKGELSAGPLSQGLIKEFRKTFERFTALKNETPL